METYDSHHIKNIVVAGASKSGKTTLVETMLFEAGTIQRRGSVEEGNTVSDYHEIEFERGNSVYASLEHVEWRSFKINLIDTPGNDNFLGETIATLRAAETCLLVLNAQHGVEIGTELIWRELDRTHKPTLIAVNQLDHEFADFNLCVEQAKNRFGKGVVVMQYPMFVGKGFNAIIDLLKMTMYKFPANGGKPEKLPIPPEEMEKAKELHNTLVEAAAENDDTLLSLYFEKGNLDEDEMRKGLAIGIKNRSLYPIFCVSAKQNMGSGRIMGFIDNVCPGAENASKEISTDGREIPCDPKGQTILFIYKTVFEPHVGMLSFFKVVSGTVKGAMEVTVARNEKQERIGQIFLLDGKKKEPVSELFAGDLGVTVKLKDTLTNDTLYGKGGPVQLKPILFPQPRIEEAIVVKDKKEEEKLSPAFHEMMIEDPSFKGYFSSELRQNIIEGLGELHLSVIKWKLEHQYKIHVDFTQPRIQYRETIQGSALADYRHKKQSGGSGQFGEVHIQIDPWVDGMPDPEHYSIRERKIHELPWGGKLVFYNCIVGGVIDARYIPAVEKGIMEKMKNGPLTGSHVRDVRVCLFDGKMHPVDSNDISFQIAGTMAFKEAFAKAKPRLLEPIYEVEVLTPDEVTGEIMTDITTRRGIILGIDTEGQFQKIMARVPLSELYRYTTALHAISKGRAIFHRKFVEYAPVPEEMKSKLVEAHKQEEAVLSH